MQFFRVSIPPAVSPTLLRQMDVGSLTCAQSASRTHEGGGGGGSGSGTNKSAQELTRRDRKTLSSCPARGSNPGSSDLNSNALTNETRPPPSPPQHLQGSSAQHDCCDKELNTFIQQTKKENLSMNNERLCLLALAAYNVHCPNVPSEVMSDFASLLLFTTCIVLMCSAPPSEHRGDNSQVCLRFVEAPNVPSATKRGNQQQSRPLAAKSTIR